MSRFVRWSRTIVTALCVVTPLVSHAQSSRDLLTIEVATCVAAGTVEYRHVDRRGVMPTECPASRGRTQTHFGLLNRVAMGEERTERDSIGNIVTHRTGPQVEVTVLPVDGTTQFRIKGRVRAGAEFYGAEEGWVEIDEVVDLGEGLFIGTWPSADRVSRSKRLTSAGSTTPQVERVWVSVVERSEAFGQR